MQRPMHFYPKLESKPWWDPMDFPWAMKLLQAYGEIRAEVGRPRWEPTGSPPGPHRDPTGSPPGAHRGPTGTRRS